MPLVPPEYSGRHMPSGWWTDPKMIEAGRKTFNAPSAVADMASQGRRVRVTSGGAREMKEGKVEPHDHGPVTHGGE